MGLVVNTPVTMISYLLSMFVGTFPLTNVMEVLQGIS